ncbi:MAG TPA: ABC transporter permease [Thermomicrobiales bacterium]|nr:ABC transporter permease [Thermomicrobiales bacterium]HQZ90726.1 ABC transporter permease [Thermomicrobiales bacterium]
MGRGQYILRRLVQMIPVLLGITVIVFFLIRAIPGDPAIAMLGERATEPALERMRHAMGLDKPLYVQYAYFMRDLAKLDLGKSTRYGVPVTEILFTRLRVSLFVVVYTTVLTTLLSLPLGILAALKKDSLFDNIVRSAMMVTLVMPSFWVGIMFIILFSVKLGIFPVSGYGTGFLGHLHHLFLPSLTISLTIAPILIRALRNSILEVMNQDYVKTARAKGLAEQSVMTVHVLRNALIPAVTLLGISIGGLMGGTVITEKVFALPGAGALLIDSITARDYAMLQAGTLVFACLVILVNLATDIIYSFLDPRVRF